MKMENNQLINTHNCILNILNDENNHRLSKLVGGCVRDFLFSGKISNDTDISTILQPEDVKKRILNYKKNNKNEQMVILDRDEKYGTIVIIFNGIRYEITTTRADINCFGRQANVEFCKDFFIDSQRRDFTINALYMDIDGNIYDFHNGLKDLQERKISFIGNAKDRIQEDYLRIIRFFRFSTKFNNFNIDKELYSIIQKTKDGILKLSCERIRNEIFKILEYNNWLKGLCFLKENDLFDVVFKVPNDIKTQKNCDNFFDKDDKIKNKIIRLSYFFCYDFLILSSFVDTLKLMNEEKRTLKLMHELLENMNNDIQNSGKLPLDFKYKIFSIDNNELINNLLPLFTYNMQKNITNFIKTKKKLPISTDVLISKGYQKEQLGKKIKELTMLWINDNFVEKDFIKHVKNEKLKTLSDKL